MSAGLSAEREAEIRDGMARGVDKHAWAWLAKSVLGLLAALDAERERRRRAEQREANLRELVRYWQIRADRAEQQVETLAEALQDIRARIYFGSERRALRDSVDIAEAALAGYRAGRDEAKP